ncbi:uncharacterized protein L969DRAFT_52083, partial [Mixia osmundae IAM 14324]|uniref:uncharacterized protein n=1 Tax=Mixia osmundae (strain CBS 9802 / IAM 14324 / JCM 22182 / KY 12970) TaxID=764103 RepID=UPI0004A54EBD
MLPNPRALRRENHQTWREIAIGQLSRYCTGCQRPCDPPIFARLDSRLPHGFVGGFCRECFKSATAATRLTRHPAKHTRIYWHAREERYGRYYTASERRNDAFQRHVDLFRVAPGQPVSRLAQLRSPCRLCADQRLVVLQRRWIEFQSWILGNSWTHLRAARRLRRQQDEDEWSHLRVIASDRPNLWQKYAEADEQRPHLNVKKLGVALTKAEMKVLSRTFGRPSLQKGDPDYTYDLTDII